jgi:hypothetical protein
MADTQQKNVYRLYALATIGVTVGAIWNAIRIHHEFYPVVIYLATNKFNIAVSQCCVRGIPIASF